MVIVVNNKRRSMTILFMVLTLTSGFSSINSLTSLYSNAFAVENKISDSISKTCSSNSQSKDIKEFLTKAIRSCLPNGVTTIPPLPNANTAVLVITSILRVNCDWLSCPNIDGSIYLDSNCCPERVFSPDTRKAGGTEKFYVEYPVNTRFDIRAYGFPGWFTDFELANIRGDCVGINTCSGVVGPQGAQVEINWHYSCKSIC